MELIHNNKLVTVSRVTDVIPEYNKSYYFDANFSIYKDAPVTSSDELILVTPAISGKNKKGTVLQIRLQKLVNI